MNDNIIDILHHQLKSGLEESMAEIRRDLLQEIAEDPEYAGEIDILVAALDNLLDELKIIKSLNPDEVPVRQRAKILAYLGLVNNLLEELEDVDDLDEEDDELWFLSEDFDDEEDFDEDFEDEEGLGEIQIKPKKKPAAAKPKNAKPKAAKPKAAVAKQKPAPAKKKK